METDSLSCLRSVGASVPFTSLYVLFKIYLLNLNALELWPWLELKRSRMLHCTFSLHLFTWDCFILLLQSKHIELCNTIDFSVHLAETTCRRCSYLRLLSKILFKPQPLFLLQFLLEKKKSKYAFLCSSKICFKHERLSPSPILSASVCESQRSGRGAGVSAPSCVLRPLSVCRRVHTALSCLVPVPKLSWNLIRL